METSKQTPATRIDEIEATLALLWSARLAAYQAHNSAGHEILCRSIDHFNAELRAMVAPESEAAQ